MTSHAPRIPAPSRHIASMQRRIHPAELERLAWMLRTQPHASLFRSVSETSGQTRMVSRLEAEWLLNVTGVRA